jgi:hypothetical protein
LPHWRGSRYRASELWDALVVELGSGAHDILAVSGERIPFAA